jgi:hypothetical protein
MPPDVPRSLRDRERQLREAGFTKSEAREILRQPPSKYPSLSYTVSIRYPERRTTPEIAGGAGKDEVDK